MTAIDLSTIYGIPPGAIMPYATPLVSTPPTGWLYCNGQAVSRTTYGALFSLIGTNYGAGDGSTTFNVPDLRGRTVFGADQNPPFDAGPGTKAGTVNHVHSVAGTAWALLTSRPSGNFAPLFVRVATGASWTPNIQSSGGSNAATNAQGAQADGTALQGGTDTQFHLPPYMVLNYIIKT
jgi:microcystin-dependent protein